MNLRALKLICATTIFCVGTLASAIPAYTPGRTDSGLIAMIFGGIMIVVAWNEPPGDSTPPTNTS